MDLLQLDYLISSGAGGAAVWVAVRTHLQFIWRDIDRERKARIDLEKRVSLLERARGVICES